MFGRLNKLYQLYAIEQRDSIKTGIIEGKFLKQAPGIELTAAPGDEFTIQSTSNKIKVAETIDFMSFLVYSPTYSPPDAVQLISFDVKFDRVSKKKLCMGILTGSSDEKEQGMHTSLTLGSINQNEYLTFTSKPVSYPVVEHKFFIEYLLIKAKP